MLLSIFPCYIVSSNARAIECPGAWLSDPKLDSSHAPSRIHATLLGCWKSRFASLAKSFARWIRQEKLTKLLDLLVELLKFGFFSFSPIDGFGDGKRHAIMKTRNTSGDSSGTVISFRGSCGWN
jgi:hypothetical protein